MIFLGSLSDSFCSFSCSVSRNQIGNHGRLVIFWNWNPPSSSHYPSALLSLAMADISGKGPNVDHVVISPSRAFPLHSRWGLWNNPRRCLRALHFAAQIWAGGDSASSTSTSTSTSRVDVLVDVELTLSPPALSPQMTPQKKRIASLLWT